MAKHLIIAKHDTLGIVEWISGTSAQNVSDIQAKVTREAFDSYGDRFFNHLSNLQYIVLDDDPFGLDDEDAAEVAYDDFAAGLYASSVRRPVRPPKGAALSTIRAWDKAQSAAYASRQCPNVNAPYCMAHDYDHVLERREQDDFNVRWAEMKNEAARQEAAQEAAAYLADVR